MTVRQKLRDHYSDSPEDWGRITAFIGENDERLTENEGDCEFQFPVKFFEVQFQGEDPGPYRFTRAQIAMVGGDQGFLTPEELQRRVAYYGVTRDGENHSGLSEFSVRYRE